MTDYFLGVDGGQSSTTAMIGNSAGDVIGWATAGPCNHVSGAEAREKFLRVIGGCIREAAAKAEMPPADRPHFRAACFGMSGGPADKASLLAELIDTTNLTVTHDAAIALAGALSGEPGIIVIAGTGSIAWGRNAKGETARAGGWGHIFGDEGGAFDIARQGMRAALREEEGWGPRTALTPAVIAAAEASDANEALHRFYTPAWPRSRVATIAKVVNRIADEGDPVAIEILRHSARQLWNLAASVRAQLWTDAEQCRVSFAGAVWESTIIRDSFRELTDANRNNVFIVPQYAPPRGALILALGLHGDK